MNEDVKECIRIINEFGTDVENGDIFRCEKFASIERDLKNGHLGPLIWKISELIEERFNV